jgi:hypothetical protein
MQRQPNAVDFWRGFALITIFIDHIPGLVYAKYTLINFSISDAADLSRPGAGQGLNATAGRRASRIVRFLYSSAPNRKRAVAVSRDSDHRQWPTMHRPARALPPLSSKTPPINASAASIRDTAATRHSAVTRRSSAPGAVAAHKRRRDSRARLMSETNVYAALVMAPPKALSTITGVSKYVTCGALP